MICCDSVAFRHSGSARSRCKLAGLTATRRDSFTLMIHCNIGQDHGKVITHAQSIALAPRCGSPLNEGGGKHVFGVNRRRKKRSTSFSSQRNPIFKNTQKAGRGQWFVPPSSATAAVGGASGTTLTPVLHPAKLRERNTAFALAALQRLVHNSNLRHLPTSAASRCLRFWRFRLRY
jgi:hypothetical protein